MEHGPESLPGPEPPAGPSVLQGTVEEMAGRSPGGREFRRHHASPGGAAAGLPDRAHGRLECVAAVFGRSTEGRGKRRAKFRNDKVALGREMDEIGREGAQDGALAGWSGDNEFT